MLINEDEPHIIRAKWCMDGAETLAQCGQKLREYARHLADLQNEGWELIDPVDDDYGFMRRIK